MQLDPNRDSHRLLLEMLGVMSEMADRIDAAEGKLDDLSDFVETLDESVADLEDSLFGEGEPVRVRKAQTEEDDEDDDPEDRIRYACPSCGRALTLRASAIDPENLPVCPECGKPLFPELEEE